MGNDRNILIKQLSIMNYIKYDLDNFDYNKRYKLPSEHIWDFMRDDKKKDLYFEDREELGKPIIGIVQSDPEITGQIGTMLER